jgi:hypothetical protein
MQSEDFDARPMRGEISLLPCLSIEGGPPPRESAIRSCQPRADCLGSV